MPEAMTWTSKTLLERIRDRWDEKEEVYDRLNTARESICDLFRPDLGVDYDQDHDMLMLGGDIIEGSGPFIARSASTAFQGNTVSKKLDWFKYRYSDLRLEGLDELDEDVQRKKDHMGAVYQRGNFYDNQAQYTLDGWTIGSPLSFIERDPRTRNIMTIPVHWQTYRLFYDRFNRSEGTIIKDTQWTVKKCFDRFVPDNMPMEARLKKAEELFTVSTYNAIEQGRFNERVTIWRSVFRATDPMWGKDFKAPLGGREWYDVYFEDTALKDRQNDPILTEGYFSKPYVHWDYNKKTWETASRTPCFEAIYDNHTLQQVFGSFLDSVQLRARPSMIALHALKGRLDLRSEGINYLDMNEWNYAPRPIEQVGDVAWDEKVAAYLKDNIGRHFHLELFRMFTDLAQNTNQEFRVLQLAEMAGERITQLLPTIETHENYLAEVDARFRNLEEQEGNGPFNKLEQENILDILVETLGAEGMLIGIQPEFIGTLRQTQQMQQKLKPLQYGIGALSELAAAMGDPNLVRFMVKGWDVADEALKAVNFKQKLVREKQDYDKLVEADAARQAQDQQFAQMVELMKASPAIQGEMAPNSIAGALMGPGR